MTNVKVNFMQSDGGLADVHNFNGFRAILSGPAGGVVGYALTCYSFEQHYNAKGIEAKVDDSVSSVNVDGEFNGAAPSSASKTTSSHMPLIGLDMGGTSTDVSRYDGHLEHVFENTTAGIIVQVWFISQLNLVDPHRAESLFFFQAPQLDINTVAAGGGSMLFFRAGMFVVGPESAGAHPGPVCYRKGKLQKPH